MGYGDPRGYFQHAESPCGVSGGTNGASTSQCYSSGYVSIGKKVFHCVSSSCGYNNCLNLF